MPSDDPCPQLEEAIPKPAQISNFDHSSDPGFLAYYARESVSESTLLRFGRVRERALSLLSERGSPVQSLRMLDIGCGAGTQASLWAQRGHEAHGVDVNAPLIAVGHARARSQGIKVQLQVGTATSLPFDDASMDVCLMPELLEHVQDWQACLREAVRVLKPGGLLYVSTSNALCPRQHEFNLPAYSWYPVFVKRHVEKLAVTTRPALANHARYPAVHWFTYYGLRSFLSPMAMECQDRFDVMDLKDRGTAARMAVALIRRLPPLRLISQMLTSGTVVWAVKRR